MLQNTIKPDLSSMAAVLRLADRSSPYWNILEYCRHIGIHKKTNRPTFWVARIRKQGGGYKQVRLCVAINEDNRFISRENAIQLAQEWFSSPQVSVLASMAYPVGVTQTLRYKKATCGFTVGDALRDYVEWKRIAATRSHFETNLSLINHHIIPRMGDLLANGVNNRVVTDFIRDVLQTPPKRGNQSQSKKIDIEALDQEALRKRKKTVNALIGILRLALRMAWENGEVESERSWRSIRSLPNIDAPRLLHLNRDQCHALLAHCRPDLGRIVRGALYTGCRVSELAKMRVGDVGAGIFGIHIRPSKNGRSRYVVLANEGMAFFINLSQGRPPEDLLFRMQTGRAWLGNHKHLFKAAVRAAALPEAFVFHGLRHTYASQLVQAGTPLSVVASQLGHSNTDTVSRTYGHLDIASIESHIEQGFASLDRSASIDLAALSGLRKRIALGVKISQVSTSWPRSNFTRSTFVGPRQWPTQSEPD